MSIVERKVTYILRLPETLMALVAEKWDVDPATAVLEVDQKEIHELRRCLSGFVETLDKELQVFPSEAPAPVRRSRRTPGRVNHFINQIMEFSKTKPVFSVADISELLGFSAERARQILDLMFERKMVLRKKVGVAWIYELAPSQVVVS